MSGTHSIWIVSSDDAWSERVSATLASLHLGAQHCASIKAAADRLSTEGRAPRLILLEGDSRWQEALEGCRRFSASDPFQPILVLDSDCAPPLRLRFIENGAEDCVPLDQLVPRMSAYLLRRLNQGGTAHVAAAADSGADEAPPEQPPPFADAEASHMYMRLRAGELSDALQFLTMSPRTGELRLHFFDGGTVGHIFVKRGEVIHIEFGEHTGTQAFARMLLQGDSEAHFLVGQEAVERSVRQSVSQLLLEAAVSADELADAE